MPCAAVRDQLDGAESGGKANRNTGEGSLYDPSILIVRDCAVPGHAVKDCVER